MSKEWLENVPAYFDGYLKLVGEDDILEAMQNSKAEFMSWANEMSNDKGLYAYEEGKWTVNEVLQHIIDTERIFQYRSLSIARGEMNELPGFDHDSYAKNSKANQRNLSDLISEFARLRDSSVDLYSSIDESNIKYKGMANGFVVQPILFGYLISGHLRHHLNVLEARY
ncbi:DinB family protein [Bacteroidia bacterium]|nr:DinB family protein [Bacteroidia bacterium]MDB9882649.1 DinB family protein [Bacteroidia bacterium]MDC1395498.1 DinB family protein [Bacteroidia bacterium]